jgi:hypothetical protein
MSDTKKAFWEIKNTRFATPDPRDEFLHPEARETETGAELTETQYLGFNIPEHDIHGLCYLWHHPNLGVATGGVWVWQGVKERTLSCELYDWLNYIDDSILSEDLHHFRMPNSYEVDVIEPYKKLRIRYADEARGNAFDIGFDAVAEPMVLETGFHLEQPMKTSGTLTLAGTEYPVDGYTVRDRSWGQLRAETSRTAPPMAWMTCVFGDDLAFGTTAFDTSDDGIALPGGDALRGGWICRDGSYTPVVSVTKRIQRNERTLFPESVELTITDSEGFEIAATGTVKAASSANTWPNIEAIICLVEWQVDGRTGYGDLQDVLFADWIRLATAEHTAASA